MRLVIDARLLENSGIGVYLSNVLPGVVERCATLRPLVFTAPATVNRARSLVAGNAEVRPWAAPPLSFREWLPPPAAGRGTGWWIPHYNVPLLATAPLVVTLHDVLPLSEFAAHWPLAKRLVVRAWMSAIRSRARRVICSSTFTSEEAVRLGGIDPARIDVVPLGVSPAESSPVAPPRPGGEPYLLFVGLIKPHKNLAGLLRAFEELMPHVPHRLVVVGGHAGLRDVDSAAVAMAARLAPRVQVLEDVSSATLKDLMSGADLLVQPSFYEGWGLPPLEAMALGTPVLVARAASLPEVCGDAALYFDPHSPKDIAGRIREALGDAALRARLGARGLDRARQFSWASCAERTSNILLAAFGNGAAADQNRP